MFSGLFVVYTVAGLFGGIMVERFSTGVVGASVRDGACDILWDGIS